MDEKREFLQDGFLSSSIIAGLQHANIYLSDISDYQRARFRKFLQKSVLEISREYHIAVDDAQHEKNIVRLADMMSESFGMILEGRRFRIGNAQKVLNLFLKYLWCANEIPVAPQCPFDRRIIELLPKEVQMNWTQMDNISDYRRLVNAARQAAKPESLAEWELKNFRAASSIYEEE